MQPNDKAEQQAAAERSLLSQMYVAAAEDLMQVFGMLTRESFSVREHSTLFQAMQSLYESGQALGDYAVQEAAERLSPAISRSWLAEMGMLSMTAANVVHYAKIVQAHSVRRMLRSLAHQLGLAADDDSQPVDAVIEKGVASLIEIGINSGWKQPLDLIESQRRFFADTLETRTNNGPDVSGVRTGLRHVDELTEGLKPGTLTVLAAGTGAGKSALALSLLIHAVEKQKFPGFIATLEMTNAQLIERMLSMRGRIPAHMLARSWEKKLDYNRLAATAEALSKAHREAGIWIDDSANTNIDQIYAKARMLRMRYGIRLLVVDYLQLVDPTGKHQTREREVASISRKLKLMAMNLDIVVVAVSQLSRSMHNRKDSKPELADLRESGAIEQDADVVLFVHRDLANANNEAEVKVAKNRGGKLSPDWEPIAWRGQFYTFEDV